MTFVQDGHLNVSVIDGLRVVRPVTIALFTTFLHAPSQHDDGPGAGLPGHPPEVVPGRMQRTLSHDELPRRIETLHCQLLRLNLTTFSKKFPTISKNFQEFDWNFVKWSAYGNVVGVDVIGALLIVGGQQL